MNTPLRPAKTLGVILAAGKSSRLYPATLATTKQLVPVYDKPLIYYPLTTLMLAGVQDVIIITSKEEQPIFKKLFGTGTELGMRFDYIVQETPEGIAQSLMLVNSYLATEWDTAFQTFDSKQYNSVFLILGDNMFYGGGLTGVFQNAVSNCVNWHRAQNFFHRVRDPQRFGVGEFDSLDILIGIEEKPENPKSLYASVGAYLYPMNTVTMKDGLRLACDLKKSARGEYEITDLNKKYLELGFINGTKLPRGTSWFDCGTYDSLLEASQFVKTIQDHQGFMVGSPHEIAYNRGWIGPQELGFFVERTGGKTKNAYNAYLHDMVLCQ